MDDIRLTRDEFDKVYEALRLANSGYSEEEVPELVAKEGIAWEVLQEVRHRAGLPEWDPLCGDGRTS